MNNFTVRLEFQESCLKQDKVTFTLNNVVDLFTAYELDTCLRGLNTDFTLKNCLFGAVKLTKNADPEKYSYSEYGIGFDWITFFSSKF